MFSPPLLSCLPGAPCRVSSWSPGMSWVWALEAPALTRLPSEWPWAVFLSFFLSGLCNLSPSAGDQTRTLSSESTES